MIEFFFYGALGGLTRSTMGYLKTKESFDVKKALFNIIGTALVGGVVGLVVDHSMLLALTAGYSSVDVAENVLKFAKEQTHFPS